MKNGVSDLNNYLFEEIERLQDDEMDEEKFLREIQRSLAITEVAKAIIKNGELALRAQEFAKKFRAEELLPHMLIADKND